MSALQRPSVNNSRSPPRGIPPLPERSRRNVARVNYAALDDNDPNALEQAQQRPAGNSSRARSAAKSVDDAEYEAGSSSDEGELNSISDVEVGLSEVESEFEELSEDDGGAAGAAEGLVELADAAMQEDQQRHQTARKAAKGQYADAR